MNHNCGKAYTLVGQIIQLNIAGCLESDVGFDINRIMIEANIYEAYKKDE